MRYYENRGFRRECRKNVKGDPLIYADQSHRVVESRFVAFDKYKNRNMYVVFITFRAIDGLLKIRVISARYAHKKEAGKFHEKKTNS